MTGLTLRLYNVGFGDAVVLSLPDTDATGADVTRTVLIDAGNALTGTHGDDDTLRAVLRDIHARLAGAPLDLYIMTHEHLDHIQGPLMAARKDRLELRARSVWMTASSEPGYYDAHPEARRKRRLALDAFEDIAEAARGMAGALPFGMDILLGINNPRASADCVDYIRDMSAPAAPHYVSRQSAPTLPQPFRDASLRVLAPEQDCSVYYGRLKPRALGLRLADGDAGAPASATLTAPEGVRDSDFADLLSFRAASSFANLFHIDRAANDSSIVFEFEWRGWRLLFPGDAEERSWAFMEAQQALRPAHFLKVSHHGSHNGTPDAVLSEVLPEIPADARDRLVAVSTADGAYRGVPHDETLSALGQRARLLDTRSLAKGGWFELTFPADGGPITVSEGAPPTG